MTYNPFAKQKYTQEQCAKLFDGSRESGIRAAATMKADPELYRSIRESAVAWGFVGPVREHQFADAHRRQLAKLEKEQGKGLTAEQAAACARFSQEECHRLLHKTANDPGLSMHQLAKDDPEAYRQFRTAAVVHGELDEAPLVEIRDHRPKYAPKPEPKPVDNLLTLSDWICDEAKLPRGTRAKDTNEYLEITNGAMERQNERLYGKDWKNVRTKSEAAAVATEGDKVTTPATDSNGDKHE